MTRSAPSSLSARVRTAALTVVICATPLALRAHEDEPGPHDYPAFPMKGASVRGGLRLVGKAGAPGSPALKRFSDVWADGDLAVVGNPARKGGGVSIFDISQPAAPAHIKTWDPVFDCNGRCQNVAYPGFLEDPEDLKKFADVVVKNGIGYFASDAGAGIYLVDLTAVRTGFTRVRDHITKRFPPRNFPTPPAGCPASSQNCGFQTMAIHDLRVETIGTKTYLFAVGISERWDRFNTADPFLKFTEIFDVTNPDEVKYVSRMWHKGWVHDVTVKHLMVNGTLRSYLIGSITCEDRYPTNLGNGWLEIWDVTNPTAPTLRKQMATGYNTHSSFPTEDLQYLYITHENTSLERPDTPFAGNIGIWRTNLHTSSLGDMSKVAELNPVDLGFDVNHMPHDPWVVGNRLYVSWYKEGLQLFDIANPTRPVHIGGYRTSTGNWSTTAWTQTGNWGVFPLPNSNLVLASDIEHGLFVFSADERKVVASGSDHTVLVKADGSLWAWGKNDRGQLGKGHTNPLTGPQQVQSLDDGINNDWVAADAGQGFTVAMRRDGSLWAWGNNSNGNLGDGSSSNNRPTVQRVCPNTGQACHSYRYRSFAVGGLHVLAIRTDGSLFAWGYNGEGQLGTGVGTGDMVSPTLVPSPQADWATVAAGSNHSLATRQNGSLWGWGWNAFGQTGSGSTAGTLPTPTQEPTGSLQWVAAKGGQRHSLGIQRNGTLWTWGDNTWGQLGIGSLGGTRLLPQPGPAGTSWATIASGQSHAAALNKNGELWSWGVNQFGQIGDGTSGVGNYRPTPVRESTGTSPWLFLEAREHNTFAVRADGTILAWGDNPNGVLGTGSPGVVITRPQSITSLSTNSVSIADASLNSPGTVDLSGSTKDRIDWAHWGRGGAADFNRKATTPKQIGYTPSGTLRQLVGGNVTFTWSDGAPAASAMTSAAVYVNGVNNGFTLRVPANTSARTLTMYVALKNADTSVEANFLGAAGAPSATRTVKYTDSVIRYRRLTVSFTGVAAGEELRVSWKAKSLGSGGWLALAAAILE